MDNQHAFHLTTNKLQREALCFAEEELGKCHREQPWTNGAAGRVARRVCLLAREEFEKKLRKAFPEKDSELLVSLTIKSREAVFDRELHATLKAILLSAGDSEQEAVDRDL